jgi:hypothetical protein
MARDASRLRSGFFAIPPEALDVALRWLKPGAVATVLDPCAGEGLALKQIGQALGVPEDRLYAVELDMRRGEACRQNLPGANVLAPCSYFHTAITPRSFSMVYANAPFDDSSDGDRIETRFFINAYNLLADGGILLGVCPEYVIQRYDIRKAMHAAYDDLRVVAFPASVRKYQEVFVVARKKASSGMYRSLAPGYNLTPRIPDGTYTIPPSTGPRRFEKTALTDEEVIDLLDKSPLKSFLKPREARALPSPPLALGVGHLALLLSAGQLDGLVKPDGEEPHLVRGTARKEKHLLDEEVTFEGNKRIVKQHFTERIKLVVRCVTAAGEIVTLE